MKILSKERCSVFKSDSGISALLLLSLPRAGEESEEDFAPCARINEAYSEIGREYCEAARRLCDGITAGNTRTYKLCVRWRICDARRASEKNKERFIFIERKLLLLCGREEKILLSDFDVIDRASGLFVR